MEEKIIKMFKSENNNTVPNIAKTLGVSEFKIHLVINNYLNNLKVYETETL